MTIGLSIPSKTLLKKWRSRNPDINLKKKTKIVKIIGYKIFQGKILMNMNYYRKLFRIMSKKIKSILRIWQLCCRMKELRINKLMTTVYIINVI